MNAKALAVQFQFTHMVLNRNLEGITHDESMQLPPSGNCLNWVAGHITATRDHILGILDESPVWTFHNKESYTRGSTPWKNGHDAERLETIREKFEESQKKLSAKIQSLDHATLSAPVPPEKNAFRVDSLAELLAAFAFHESYHVGQTGILRRLAGKEGAIK
ncbi:MAG TPA: DinB family protein [bacterium]|nr:DinB family protein [bacterium]